TVVDIHLRALEQLRSDIKSDLFEAALDILTRSRRVFAFGIGPSSALADYFVLQLNRFGLEGRTMTNTGLRSADDLHALKPGDVVVILAYTHVYQELEVLLAHAKRVGAHAILLTDSLRAVLRKNVDLVLPVARGQADWFSTHTATLGLLEALL